LPRSRDPRVGPAARAVNSSDVAIFTANWLQPILTGWEFPGLRAVVRRSIYAVHPLVGCVLPRLRDHLNALLGLPPAARAV
jgi:hypothetical protein